MKSKLLILALIPAFIACRSVDFPKPETSQRQIDSLKPLIAALDQELNVIQKDLPSGKEMILQAQIKPFNAILEKLAYQRNDDITLIFNESKGIIKEDKSAFGINYTNQVDISGGKMDVNLKSFKFESIEGNKVTAKIELEGFGKVSVGGKYMGVPAQITPDIQLYLNEPITLAISSTKPGFMTLTPEWKQLALKTKISINLLGWAVPFYKEIPLQITDLMKPIDIPIALKPEIQFPLPAQKFGDSKIDFAPYVLEFSAPEVWAWGNKIEYKANLDFKKK